MIVVMIIATPEAIASYYCNSGLNLSEMISTVCFLCNEIVQLNRLLITEKGKTINTKSLFKFLGSPGAMGASHGVHQGRS